MSWYKTGQIAVTNGSRVVVGVGTNFTRFVEVGEALLGPDGQHYEITSVPSATELRIGKNYAGPTAANQSYTIVPVQGYVRELAHKAADLIDAHKGVPAEALSHAEAAAQSAVRSEAAKVGLESAKAQAESSATDAATSKTSAASSATAAATSATNAAASATAAATSATNAAASATAAANSATAASTSATNAASSATAAANSATAAVTSKTAAATSESAALSSKNAAAASATAAATSETNAASSATAAAASKTAAESSASAANTSKIAAEASKTAAASSASSALASKNAAEAALNGKENTGTAAAAVAAHTAASDPHPQYQVDLVSGTNIKTINGQSILGAGNIEIQGGVGPTLQGDTAPYVTQTKTYQITNHNSFSSYAVAASAGTANISGDTITFTAPAAAGSVSLTITVDGQPTAFVIAVQAVPSYIPTPTPTPANFGDPLEGGFYAGMVWGQIAQSSTSAAIGTGSKTFTVPSMTAAPIVYSGQTVEVRSRANPANKFVGTVTGAAGTNLTINVTSIDGSGTFSDWSVMARHRVIVAPKAGGEHAGIMLKNANTALPTACQTLTDGLAATQAMRDADTSAVYPAAHWVRNLAIGGRTDWYIPARDELELCWRNLKPTTAANYTGASRPAAASFSYANNGSYGDTANTHGTNNNSSPTGAAYTASVPGQTAATAFRTGGAEAYEFGSALYWSSSDYIATQAWFLYLISSNPGYQSNYGKLGALRVRAVRRSII